MKNRPITDTDRRIAREAVARKRQTDEDRMRREIAEENARRAARG